MSRSDFEHDLIRLMTQYRLEVQSDIEEIIRDVAHQAVVMLHSTAPVGRTKRYAKSFDVHVESKAGKVRFTAYSKSPHYRLTHLLEQGHKTTFKTGKYGGKKNTTGKQHFAQVQDWADKEAMRRIEEVLKK